MKRHLLYQSASGHYDEIPETIEGLFGFISSEVFTWPVALGLAASYHIQDPGGRTWWSKQSECEKSGRLGVLGSQHLFKDSSPLF